MEKKKWEVDKDVTFVEEALRKELVLLLPPRWDVAEDDEVVTFASFVVLLLVAWEVGWFLAGNDFGGKSGS